MLPHPSPGIIIMSVINFFYGFADPFSVAWPTHVENSKASPKQPLNYCCINNSQSRGFPFSVFFLENNGVCSGRDTAWISFELVLQCLLHLRLLAEAQKKSFAK